MPELVKYINLYINIWVSRKNQSNSDHRSNTKQPHSNMNTVDDIEHTYNNLKLEENRAMWGVISKVMERLDKIEEMLVSSRNGEEGVTTF